METIQTTKKLECLEPTVYLRPPCIYFKPYSEGIFTTSTPCILSQEFHFKPTKFEEEKEQELVNDQKENSETEMNRGEWSKEEHVLFIQGNKIYRKNWAMIAKNFVKTRTRQQVRNHAVKYFLKTEKQNKIQKVTHKKSKNFPVLTFNY